MKLFGKKKGKALPEQPATRPLIETELTEPTKASGFKPGLHPEMSYELVNQPRTAPSKKNSLPSDNTLPLLNLEQCYQAYEVTHYTDGSQTWEPLYVWCEPSVAEDGNGGSGGGASPPTFDESYVCPKCTTVARNAQMVRDRTIENAYIDFLGKVAECFGTGSVIYQLIKKSERLNPYAPLLGFLVGSGYAAGSWAQYQNSFDIANAEYAKTIAECSCN